MYMRLVIGNKRKQKSVIKVADLVAEVEWKWIRNIYLRISPADARIRISAPMTMSEEEIKKFMLSKEAWIRQRIDRANVQKHPAPYEYVSGEYHYYKGHKYSLKVVCHNGAAKVETEGNEYIILYVREGTTMKRREEVLREWYRAELKVLLTELIAKWEQIIGVKANQITVKQMKTIWGSCNHRTHNINFNLELMKRPVHCIEYVVVHELLHIIVRLHNDKFKSLLTHYFPNWRKIKAELNDLYI